MQSAYPDVSKEAARDFYNRARDNDVAGVRAVLKQKKHFKQELVNCDPEGDGYTPLHAATENGHVAIVKLLLKARAKLDWQGGIGGGYLHLVATKGYADVAEALIANGAAVDQEDFLSQTPLFVAAKNGKAEVVWVLLNAGADKNCHPSALQAAREGGHTEAVKYLEMPLDKLSAHKPNIRASAKKREEKKKGSSSRARSAGRAEDVKSGGRRSGRSARRPVMSPQEVRSALDTYLQLLREELGIGVYRRPPGGPPVANSPGRSHTPPPVGRTPPPSHPSKSELQEVLILEFKRAVKSAGRGTGRLPHWVTRGFNFQPHRGSPQMLPKDTPRCKIDGEHVRDQWTKVVEEFTSESKEFARQGSNSSNHFERFLTEVEGLDGKRFISKPIYLSLALALTGDWEDSKHLAEEYMRSNPSQPEPVLLLILAKMLRRDKKRHDHARKLMWLYFNHVQKPGFATSYDMELLKQPPTQATNASRARKEDIFDEVKNKWIEYKKVHKVNSAAMDELMELTGLHKVKAHAFALFDSRRSEQRLNPGQRVITTANFIFGGNPGTGKTTVAKILARILYDTKIRRKDVVVTTDGGKLQKMTAANFRGLIFGSSGGPPPPNRTAGAVGTTAAEKLEQVERQQQQLANQIQELSRKQQQASQPLEAQALQLQVQQKQMEQKQLQQQHQQLLQQKAQDDNAVIGGVLFIDEAHKLDPLSGRHNGEEILNEIMDISETQREDLTIIMAGYKKDIEENILAADPGMGRRFPVEFNWEFEDFTEAELRSIFRGMVKKSGWVLDKADKDKCADVAARRLAAGRGRYGFGNAGEVRNLFQKAYRNAVVRQAVADNTAPEIKIEDVLGPRPDKSRGPLAEALRELRTNFIGLETVKKEIYALVDNVIESYDLEMKGSKPTEYALNRLMIGNPGTGKTTVAKIYGKILKYAGILSDGEVVVTTASDFIGEAEGVTKHNTKRILKRAAGKVLVIDEAYSLNDQNYGREALDTIVEKVHNKPGDDIAVLMLGYPKEMFKMLREQNPGLSRRFNPENALRFNDFDRTELRTILKLVCRKKELYISYKTVNFAVDLLEKQKVKPNFGNAGAIDSMLSDAQLRMSARYRMGMTPAGARQELTIQDFIRAKQKGAEKTGIAALDDLYNTGDIKKQLMELKTSLETAKSRGKRDLLKKLKEGLNFVFTGRPGTGKTTVARCLAGVLYELGIVATPTLVETSALNMQGQHVGSTKALVKKKMEEARGGVFFIDEAYELVDVRGSYAKEAVGTLLTQMSSEEHKRTVVVLAGYPDEMKFFMENTNPGINRRFKKILEFKDWSPSDCAKFLMGQAKSNGYNVGVDASYLEKKFTQLRNKNPGKWGNASDADAVFTGAQQVSLSRRDGDNLSFHDFEKTFQEKMKIRPPAREGDTKAPSMHADVIFAADDLKESVRERQRGRNSNQQPAAPDGKHADGDRKRAQKKIKEGDEKLKDDAKLMKNVTEEEKLKMKKEHEAKKMAEEAKEKENEKERARRQALIDAIKAKLLQEALEEEERKRIEEEMKALEEQARKAEEARKLAAAYKKVLRIGCCEAGYGYTKVDGGWRCNAGGPACGYHVVSDEQVAAMQS